MVLITSGVSVIDSKSKQSVALSTPSTSTESYSPLAIHVYAASMA